MFINIPYSIRGIHGLRAVGDVNHYSIAEREFSNPSALVTVKRIAPIVFCVTLSRLIVVMYHVGCTMRDIVVHKVPVIRQVNFRLASQAEDPMQKASSSLLLTPA